MFACKMERIPLPCAFYFEFRIPNSAFAPLQNASTYGKIERADESQRNIGSDDRETVALYTYPLSREPPGGARRQGARREPSSREFFPVSGGWAALSPIKRRQSDFSLPQDEWYRGFSPSHQQWWDGLFFHPQWSFTVIRRNIRNEREDRSPEKQL